MGIQTLLIDNFRPWGIFGLTVFGLTGKYSDPLVLTFSVYWFRSYGPDPKKSRVYLFSLATFPDEKRSITLGNRNRRVDTGDNC